MCSAVPLIISEKRIRSFPTHLKPEAFRISMVGVPPVTGTVQVSQEFASLFTAVYATCEPSGVNTGLYFSCGSFVSWIDWPSGSAFT